MNKLPINFLPPLLRDKVAATTTLALKHLKPIRRLVSSVVVAGGWKTQEITYTDKKLISDIDLFVVSNYLPLFWTGLSKLNKSITQQHNIEFHYRGFIPKFLKRSTNYWAYKLKHEGIVIWGNRQILEKIPATETSTSVLEAIRILFQNLVLWLQEFENNPQNGSSNKYMVVRSYLNIGEAYLSYFGKLAPTYAQRKSNWIKLADTLDLDITFQHTVAIAYDLKINNYLDLNNERLLINLTTAKEHYLQHANKILSYWSGRKFTLHHHLEKINQDTKREFIWNLTFYFFTKWSKLNLRPKLIPIMKNFHPVELYRMASYYYTDNPIAADRIYHKYFNGQNCNNQTIVELFKLWPLPITMSLNVSREAKF
jgi:hypothetical protein